MKNKDLTELEKEIAENLIRLKIEKPEKLTLINSFLTGLLGNR